MSGDLKRLRDRIDRLDRALVRRLAERQRLVEAVARIKADPLRARDPRRVEDVIANILRSAAEQGLSPDIAEPVWRLLMDRCADHETAILVSAGESPQPEPDHDGACCGCKFDAVALAQGARAGGGG
ncbi:chorismate mutase [Brevundimonas sp.]|uniref:chorismate mutase n=1 Tax=Brevundimonas sp. TaxID=1871086 RepID=UPI002FCA72D9